MKTIKIFRYLDELDCFAVSDEYRRIADHLGLTEEMAVLIAMIIVGQSMLLSDQLISALPFR